MLTYEVELIELEPQPAAIIRGYVTEAAIPQFMATAFADVQRALKEQGVKPAGRPLAHCTPSGEEFTIEAGFPTSAPVKPSGRVWPIELPGGPAARTLHQGAYDAIRAAYDALDQWATEHDYVHTARAWESYLDTPDVPHPRTLVTLPCRPRD